MSLGFVGKRKAVVYAPLCPVPLIQELKERGYTLIEVPQNEFEVTQGTYLYTIIILIYYSLIMQEMYFVWKRAKY